MVDSLHTPLRILVIEPDRLVAGSLVAMLRGQDVTVCHDGAAGPRLARARHFDAVVMELCLGPDDGVVTWQALPTRLRARTVFLTGGDVDDSLAQRASQTDVEVLLKPIGRDALLAAIARALQGWAGGEPADGEEEAG